MNVFELHFITKGENFESGVVSIKFPESRNASRVENYGNIEHIEGAFEKHRLEKIDT